MNGTYVAADNGQALGVFSYYEGPRNQGSKCFHLLRFLWPNQQLKCGRRVTYSQVYT